MTQNSFTVNNYLMYCVININSFCTSIFHSVSKLYCCVGLNKCFLSSFKCLIVQLFILLSQNYVWCLT